MDPGTAAIKIAPGSPDDRTVISPSPGGGQRAVMSAALAAGGLAQPPDHVCLAVPDSWLDGSADGVRAQEALRQVCQDELGIERIAWVGQLAAAAALAATQRGPGRYLACDVGASGVRVAALEVTGPTVRTVAVHSTDGGGWRDFDAAIRSPGAERDPLPADWYLALADQDRRARPVLEQAVTSAAYRDARAYTVASPHGRDLVAGELIDCFAPARQRLGAGISKVLAAGSADFAMLVGGLSWLPLASIAIAEFAQVSPFVAGLDTAVRGALRFARDEVRTAPTPTPLPVTFSLHQVKDGLLEEVNLVLPWTEPFARLVDGPLLLDSQDLVLQIDGRPTAAHLPGLVPGPYQIGVRTGWSGSSALIARPTDGGEPVIVPLATKAVR